MLRLGKYITVLLFAGSLVVSCDKFGTIGGGLGIGGKITAFEVGYTTRASKFEKMLGPAEDTYVPFTSQEAYEMVKESDSYEEGMTLRNRFEYSSKDLELDLKVYPANTANVKQIVVTSSDTTVIRVLGTSMSGIKVRFGELGDTDITVKVIGKENELTQVFPLRVIGTVDLRVRITAFWLRNVATKLRMGTKKLPSGVKDMVLWSKDSVTVVGYCGYYDLKKYGSREIAVRDTVTYSMKEFWCRYKKGYYYLLRDITPAVRQYNLKFQEGTKLQQRVDDFGKPIPYQYDTVPHQYRYSIEQVILSYYAICDNPFIEFVTTVKCNKSFEHVSGSAEYPEADGEGPGAIKVEDENEDDENDKETVNYFKVTINDFLTQRQKDSLMNIVTETKRKYNYNEQLTEEQKDAAMAKINENMDD